jgi:hypothetical protein
VGLESGVVGLSKWRISSSSASIRDMGSSMDLTSTTEELGLQVREWFGGENR